ncbi:MAG: hypothetical protein Q8Q91_00025 [Candidatus Daviesbacteria bacterium]|nr:hypothetical protein [Candidatus Daviesbacteria bacterium]
MAKKMMSGGGRGMLGSWSFLVGLLLAVLLGVGLTGPYAGQMTWAVFLLGIVIGLLNITSSEASAFLTSGTVLVLVSYLGASVLGEAAGSGFGVDLLVSVLNSVLVLFVPATIVVAVRAVFGLARN